MLDLIVQQAQKNGKKEIKELKEEIKKLTIDKSIAQTSTQSIRRECHYCNRMGHDITEC